MGLVWLAVEEVRILAGGVEEGRVMAGCVEGLLPLTHHQRGQYQGSLGQHGGNLLTGIMAPVPP